MRWAEQCSSHSQWGPRAEGAVSCPHKTALTHLRCQPDSGGSRPPGLLTNCLQIWGFPPPPLVQSFARISRRTPESTTLMIVVLPRRTSPGRGAQGEGRQGLEGTASAPSGATPRHIHVCHQPGSSCGSPVSGVLIGVDHRSRGGTASLAPPPLPGGQAVSLIPLGSASQPLNPRLGFLA